MKETLELIIKTLVDDENSVSINQIEKENEITFEVAVAEKDMGKIIGKLGRIAKSIRTIIRAVASKEQKKSFDRIFRIM